MAWAALATTTLMLCDLRGAVLFWVHTVYLGEPGPRVRPILHYVLDSSAGVIGLTPPLALILPFAVWAARDRNGAVTGSLGSGGVRSWRYAWSAGPSSS